MTDSMKRREFLTGSLAATSLAATVGLGVSGLSQAAAAPPSAKQEFYELRVHRVASAEKQNLVSNYLQKALAPALNRMGVDRVGVFTVMDNPEQKAADLSIFTLIPYPTLESFAQLNVRLASDSDYQKAAADYFAAPKDDPAYTRIQSRFMKAFAGMPVIETPSQTAAGKPRMFELRTYESHNEDAALRKVDMFNSGEIQLMRDVKMAPVFFGEMLIGDDVPNLTYMLSADDMNSHKEHWKAFLSHPEWDRMKKIPKYQGAVSKITKWFLVPTKYSQI